MWDLRVDLDLAEILSQLELLLRAEILVTEEDNAALGDQKSELVSLLVSQVFQLETDDFSADVCSEVLDFLRGREECGLLLVCTSAGVDIFSVFVPDCVDVLEVKRSSWAVLRELSISIVRLRVILANSRDSPR